MGRKRGESVGAKRGVQINLRMNFRTKLRDQSTECHVK